MEYSDLPNLASPLLGTRIVFATDEWFASAENFIKDDEPVWKQDDYTLFGKWMDGWESRRRRTEGHDWCIVELGLPGLIRAIEVDTAFFTGNFSPKVSILGCAATSDETVRQLVESRARVAADRPEYGRMGTHATAEEQELVQSLGSQEWQTLVPLTPLGAGYEATRKTVFKLPVGLGPMKFLRVNMGPDGGIARIRVYGEIMVRPEDIPSDREIDLVAVQNGGMAIACSNRHYGHPRNLIAPGRGNCMGDGWETARQPKRPAVYQKGSDGLLVLPGQDWSVIKLGVPGLISGLEVDTNFYKGNYPESCLVEACCSDGQNWDSANLEQSFVDEGSHSRHTWKTVLPRTRLGPSERHFFTAADLRDVGPVTHVKLTIYPDGGVMRLRVMGRRAPGCKL